MYLPNYALHEFYWLSWVRFLECNPREALMPFTLRSYRRFPVQCSVTYITSSFHGQGSVQNHLLLRRLSMLMRKGAVLILAWTCLQGCTVFDPYVAQPRGGGCYLSRSFG